MIQKKWKTLVLFFLAIGLVQFSGALFTDSSVSTWYPTLKKASWTPPGWVFGPVWTFLYIFIAIAGWLIYCKAPSKERKMALKVFWIQMGFNALWSYLFFYLQSPLLGLIDVLILFIFIGWTIYLFWKLSRWGGALLFPYFLWTFYAMTLNCAIWVLNRG